MEQIELSPLEGGVDSEVFRRVWSRVMARGGGGPIEVEPERTEAPASDQPSPGGEQPSRAARERTGAGRGDDRALLEGALRELGRGLGLAGGLARRGGRRWTALSALEADYRRAARQLGAAYFLTAGQGLRPERVRAEVKNLSLGLRELFWWESRWSEECLAASARAEDPFLVRLLDDLARTGRIHQGIIRGILEQMQGSALDGGPGRGVN